MKPARHLPLVAALATSAAVTAVARCAQAQASDAPEADEAARRLFREGVEFANDERWEDARARFRAALSLHPSALGRFNLATAARNSGHFVESVDQYRQFLRDDRDPLNAARRREAQAAIDAIEPVLARVTVTVRGPGETTTLRIDGRPLPVALLGIEAPLDPGEHVLEAEGSDGTTARAEVTLGEGATRAVTLVRVRPTAPVAAMPAPVRAPPAPPRGAPAGTIERVRRAILERASAVDVRGHRRWDHTFTAFALQGTGTPVGIFGAGVRFDARPWLGFEAELGAGHPFGPGIAIAIDPRVPLSYRYALGLSLGFATNLTTFDRGDVPSCSPVPPASTAFTPAWLLAAVTHEWRASTAVAFRLALGIRWLINTTALGNAARSECVMQRATFQPTDVVFDPPTLDHGPFPVLPWIAFDVGWTP